MNRSIEFFGNFFARIFNPLLKHKAILSFYNFLFNISGDKVVRFFCKYTYVPDGNYIWKIKLANGKKVKSEVSTNNPLSQQFPLSYRRHSPCFNLIELLLINYLPQNIPWIDVGSNLGLRSLLPLSEGRQVFFIEPNKEANRLNYERCILNNYTNFEFIEVGASNCNGSADFYLDKSSYNSTLELSFTDNNIFEFKGKEKININTLDNIFSDRMHTFQTAYIKIDVEGHELQVLNGATKFLKEVRPTMIIEVNEKGEHFVHFMDLMSTYLYEVFEIGNFKRNKILKKILRTNDGKYDITKNDFLVTNDMNLIKHLNPYLV